MNNSKNRVIANFNEMSLDKLSDYIASKHHDYVKEAIIALPVQQKTILKLDKLAHPEVDQINDQITILTDLLEQHLGLEEHILFPYIKAIIKGKMQNEKGFESNSIAIVSKIRNDHEKLEQSLNRIRKLSKNYQPSTDSSPALKLCYAQLFELEQDLHKHIFIEEQILFPKLLEFEKRMVNTINV